MADIIQLLPDSVANQIAAGEVVQRPASAVKELMENSIDAGAKNIQLIVKEGGKASIQVIDDGVGMSETDARLCFERHATSKIREANDLFDIRTMGFRGEALASIAAVAEAELKTRKATDELGTQIQINGSELVAQQPVNCAVGTNFTIKNLFYNVPARRKFLKGTSIELKHIISEFQRVALAYPEIAMSLTHN
ncbi:MAG TPA: DNA mismatch repair endonuclease MutL, partial [Tenuifilaceae bacterium]|nr:DNA mismatch repair endonuclease MutL [Tenuifilaceae bacterium]